MFFSQLKPSLVFERVPATDLSCASRVFLWVFRFSSLSKINVNRTPGGHLFVSIHIAVMCHPRKNIDAYHTLSYLSLPYLTLPHLTLPYLTLPYLTLPYLTLPYPKLPYVTLPYLTLPYLTFLFEKCTLTM